MGTPASQSLCAWALWMRYALPWPTPTGNVPPPTHTPKSEFVFVPLTFFANLLKSRADFCQPQAGGGPLWGTRMQTGAGVAPGLPRPYRAPLRVVLG